MYRTLPCHVEGRARQCKTLQGCGRSGKSFLVSPLRHAGPGDLLCGKKAKSYGLRTKRKVARPVNTSAFCRGPPPLEIPITTKRYLTSPSIIRVPHNRCRSALDAAPGGRRREADNRY